MKYRNPWEPREFSKCYCAAVATAVAGVAAAGTAAYSASQQSKNASSAQGALAGNKAGAYGTKIKPVDYKDNVNLPAYSENAGAVDLHNSLPMLGNISHYGTLLGQVSRDSLTGGASSANLNQEGADISGLLRGQVPTDVQGNINRMVAARTGGAFSPTGQANQSAAADYARRIGMTSTQMMQMGMTAAPQWESLVDAFTYKPQQAFTDALSALRERNSYTTNAAQIQLQRDQNSYMGAVNYEKMAAMPDPQIQGFTNDSLQLGNISTQQQQNSINALLGAVKSGGAAYTAATAGGDPYNSAGFIPQSNVGAAYQSFANGAPGYTPQFTTTPQGSYFSGYKPS